MHCSQTHSFSEEDALILMCLVVRASDFRELRKAHFSSFFFALLRLVFERPMFNSWLYIELSLLLVIYIGDTKSEIFLFITRNGS